jgi:hypothetical protein
MMTNVSEVYSRGRWRQAAALEVDAHTIVITGKWLKVASVRSEAWLEAEIPNPDRCVSELIRQKGQIGCADIFTFGQKLPDTSPKHSYPMEWDSVAAIRLTSFDDWWRGLPQASRKNVRRAQKRGVIVSVREFNDEIVNGLVDLHGVSPLRQGKRNREFGKSFAELKKDHSSFLDRSDFICAYFGDELIGLLKIVYCGQVATILNLEPKATHDDKRPGNALIAKAVELCAAKGMAYVTYGRFNYGNKRGDALQEFKIRNGFGEILVPRFYVPLTNWGCVCLKLGLHRGLLGMLPSRAIRVLLNSRAVWYDLLPK